MSVKIILGYLKFLNRLFQQHQIDLSQSSLDAMLLQRFENALALQSSDAMDVADYVLLMQYAQQYFQRPISLVLAEHATLQDLGLVGYLASTSLDLQHAIYSFGQYYSLLYQQTNLEALEISEHQNKITMKWQAPKQEWQVFYELNLALIYSITESIVEHQLIPPHYVFFSHQPQMPLYHYEKFFKTEVKIIHQQCGIVFPIQNLQMRNIAADLELNEVLSVQAQNALQPEHHQAIYAQKIKHKIKRLIEKALDEHLSIQAYVASKMHCSERTLQRQLKQLDFNFQDLIDEVRYEKALLYLKQAKSFSEIATLLRYSDQSAFGRAFKRWSGITPKQYVQNNRML